ncbi:hypothetical protein NQ315_008977 [Exocentrus adspersus]|uniref:Uncharacterized protein n=1 Tax=Exocentrus adspersus TaxID=1586481 RepID=A0AAV8VIZ8_9CUCU|nr:hypothetical protein NQ315_008977 [Exocentrus adspersus]
MTPVQKLVDDDPDRLVNRQNCRSYAETNPHWIVEQHTQHRAKLNVWAGVIEDRIIGPIFFMKL